MTVADSSDEFSEKKNARHSGTRQFNNFNFVCKRPIEYLTNDSDRRTFNSKADASTRVLEFEYSSTLLEFTKATNANNNIIIYNTRFVERRGAIALEALADRSSQLARNRQEKMSFKFSFK